MQLTIDIPANILQRAADLGLPVETVVAQAFQQVTEEFVPEGFTRLGTPKMTCAEAAAGIREIQRTHTLGGLKIKDLIEEGRRC